MSIDGRVRKRITRGYDTDPAWSPDGGMVYFSRSLTQRDKGPSVDFNEQCGSIFRIGKDGRGVTRLTNPPWKNSFHHHFAPAVSPDGRRIAFNRR
jgi:Tol biopolymer transport system component